MNNQQNGLSLSGNRLRCYILVIVIVLPIFTASLICSESINNDKTKTDVINFNTKQDSLHQRLLLDYHSYKLKKQFGTKKIDWFDNKMDFLYRFHKSDLINSELVDVSKKIYNQYYKNKIELYNYNDYAYIYLNLKDAQSNKGALQISVPLPNFFRVFNKSNVRD